MSWKNSLLVVWKILRLFDNTLTADDKYSLLSKNNFVKRIQVLVSQEEKLFSEFFPAFLKSALNSKYFQQKDDPHRKNFSEITDSAKSD